MSTNPTYQIQKLNEVRLSDKAMIVYKYVLENPGQTRLEVAHGTGLTEKCVCGRFGDMQPTGIIWDEPQSEGPKVLFATKDPLDIDANVRIYLKAKGKRVSKRIEKDVEWLKANSMIYLPDLPVLRPIINRIKANV